MQRLLLWLALALLLPIRALAQEAPPPADEDDKIPVVLIAVDEDDSPIPHATIMATRPVPAGGVEVQRRRSDAGGAVTFELVSGATYEGMAVTRLDLTKSAMTAFVVDAEGAPQEVRLVVRTRDDMVRTIRLCDRNSGKPISRVRLGDPEVDVRRRNLGGSDRKILSNAFPEESFVDLRDGTLELPVASWRKKQHCIIADGFAPLLLDFEVGGLLPFEVLNEDSGKELPLLELSLQESCSLIVHGIDATESQLVVLDVAAQNYAPAETTAPGARRGPGPRTVTRLADEVTFNEFDGATWRFDGLPAAAQLQIVLLDWDVKLDAHRTVSTMSLRTGLPGSTVRHTLDMDLSCSIAGISVAADGTPKAGQKVRLGNAAPEFLGEWKHNPMQEGHAAECTTDDQGRFEFASLAPGKYRVWTVSSDMAWRPSSLRTYGHPVNIEKVFDPLPLLPTVFADEPVELRTDSPRAKLQLREFRGHYISGTLSDHGGQPTTGRVLARSDDGQWQRTARAGYDSGAFLLGPLPEGSYELSVVGEGGRRWAPVETFKAGTASLALTVPQGAPDLARGGVNWTLKGRVHLVGSDEAVPLGTQIHAFSEEVYIPHNGVRGQHLPKLPPPVNAATGADGEFELALLPHANWILEVQVPGAPLARAWVRSGRQGQGTDDFALGIRRQAPIEVSLSPGASGSTVSAECRQSEFFDPAHPYPTSSLDLYPRSIALQVVPDADQAGVLRITGAPDGATVHITLTGAEGRAPNVKPVQARRSLDETPTRVQF